LRRWPAASSRPPDPASTPTGHNLDYPSTPLPAQPSAGTCFSALPSTLACLLSRGFRVSASTARLPRKPRRASALIRRWSGDVEAPLEPRRSSPLQQDWD
jgi:hypothetical protein